MNTNVTIQIPFFYMLADIVENGDYFVDLTTGNEKL